MDEREAEFNRATETLAGEMEAARRAANPLPIDSDGKVSIWHIVEARWKRIYPVDAKEQLQRGMVSLTAPSESAEPVPQTPQPEKFDIKKAPIEELRGYAESKLGIVGVDALSKHDLMQAIRMARK